MGVLTTMFGVGVVFIHYIAGGPHDAGDPEGWFASVGFAAPIIAAGLLASLGVLLNARWHWWAGGIAISACSIVSIVLFPLLVAGIVLIVLGLRTRPSHMRDLWFGALAAVGLTVPFAIVVFHQDPATWNGGSSSNIITPAEATISVTVAISVLVTAVAIAITAPKPVLPANDP